MIATIKKVLMSLPTHIEDYNVKISLIYSHVENKTTINKYVIYFKYNNIHYDIRECYHSNEMVVYVDDVRLEVNDVSEKDYLEIRSLILELKDTIDRNAENKFIDLYKCI